MNLTFILIGITCLISYLALQRPSLMDSLIFYPKRINDTFPKELYRFISSGFLHADFQHLLFNMITLYFFGSSIESFLGPFQFLILYFGAMVVTHSYTYLKHKNNFAYRSLGASGAVSAVLFACLILSPWATIYVYFIPIPFVVYAVLYIAYSFYMNRNKSDNVAHDVHIIGAVFGFIYMVIMHSELIDYFTSELLNP